MYENVDVHKLSFTQTTGKVMENYSLIIDNINQSSQRGSAILFDLYNRVKFDGYHELLRRGVYMKVMTW